jgi:hypothetical protein
MDKAWYYLLAGARYAADMLELYGGNGDDGDGPLPDIPRPGAAPYMPQTPANPDIYLPIGQPGRTYGPSEVHRRTNAAEPDSPV